ncbi:MAG: 16S rRNA (cytosine(1402)-N(4))-methyltransferase RsmH [Sphingomonas sp.]|uniref:16S rRNA (cytosine(1402)-N(4))-methyltransferase RsmH n=1 Tax=Sphingomonas TaxID=13687 RepID=UPI0004770864|nr:MULTISPECIES: 16S rRNA (cytosine(1402)-N(4))-methyltransferase RsmH [Sphingomonas]ATI55308.1 16S rRNA (cytosine(1402)-N(4))-methyltransferase RsmH [Sphingomonas melonis]MBI0531499.1 16S rRNA (cytosine(1402)-N(4))-methyltransferase RsmH [Sphingomonas sp. TX0522]MBX8843765.1 16S rRNA (cytosine(1402)-N(4))-methyltransferase RsmH [Sphingomonas melonis]MBX8853387.1 16S rRNA (cytosine(1402)-N(4))-methyltransferase RsmH [Sphingomonas melonis]MBX8898340.1 16S rRNA (cytosine(1402)-N(4))-methyltransf
MTDAPHIPVLLDEVVAALAPAPGEVMVDATFGAGGYTRAILKTGATVIAFDRDPDAIREGRAAGIEGLTLVHSDFSAMEAAIDAPVDGLTMDIGVSSMQLDQAERGFSFQSDGPLDMRMAQDGPSAADFLNTADEEAIADVLYQYGDEPKSRRVARAIVAARPLTRTGELATVVRKALGHRPHDKKDPATRTFQAIRIHVNRELGELADGLAAAERLLKPGGRLAVVTFHSLEDRMVKRFLRERSGNTPGGSRHLPQAGATRAPSFATVGRGIRAGEAELARNPRARSATLRTAIRTAAPAWNEEVTA